MKRSLKYLSILFAFILVLTGCGKKDSKKDLVDAIKKTSDLKSVKENIKVTASFKTEGQNVGVELTGDAETYKENEDSTLIHVKAKLGSMGMGYETELYADTNKEGISMYMNMLGQWMKLEQKYTQDNLKQL